MNSKLVFANISRRIARFSSIIVLLLGLPFVLFVGLQLFSEAANAAIYLSLLFLVGMLGGMIIAWWKEALGSVITFLSIAGSLLLSGSIRPGVEGSGSSIFAGPIHLLFALFIPGYHPDVSSSARLVPILSWVMLLIPAALFFASWWLRRNSNS